MILDQNNTTPVVVAYENFVFVLGSEDCKNGLFYWTRDFHPYVLLSKWDFVNKECLYSVTACKQEYVAKYRDLIIQEISLKAHIWHVINRFVRTGSINKEKSRRRLHLRTLLIIWDDLSRIEQLNTGSKALTKRCYRTFLKLNREWTCVLNRMMNIFNIYCDV